MTENSSADAVHSRQAGFVRCCLKEMVGKVLENELEAELDDELGYSKYDYRNKNTKNSRNGYSRKMLKTSGGSVEIAVPRDRNGDFEPQLIKKNETTLSGDIEEKIISSFLIPPHFISL